LAATKDMGRRFQPEFLFMGKAAGSESAFQILSCDAQKK
jgi:hypothetical protein